MVQNFEKYCAGCCDIDKFKAKATCPMLGKVLRVILTPFAKGGQYGCWECSKTLFWHLRWATTSLLIALTTQELPLNLQDVTVDEMWDKNICWKFDAFSEFLPANMLVEIVAHELIDDED